MFVFLVGHDGINGDAGRTSYVVAESMTEAVRLLEAEYGAIHSITFESEDVVVYMPEVNPTRQALQTENSLLKEIITSWNEDVTQDMTELLEDSGFRFVNGVIELTP